MKVIDRSDECRNCFWVESDDGRLHVSVCQESGLRDRSWGVPHVNWAALGNVSADAADAYAALIRKAAQLARRLDKEFPPGSPRKSP